MALLKETYPRGPVPGVLLRVSQIIGSPPHGGATALQQFRFPPGFEQRTSLGEECTGFGHATDSRHRSSPLINSLAAIGWINVTVFSKAVAASG
jgi:hypothetical protein